MQTVYQFTTAVGYVVLAVGGFVGIWGVIPRRGTQPQCPKCGYSLDAHHTPDAPPPRCPECGRTAKSIGELHRLKVRSKALIVGMILVFLSNVLFAAPRIARSGWIGAAPTSVLAALVPWIAANGENPLIFGSEKPNAELRVRQKNGELLAIHRAILKLRTGLDFWWDGNRWGLSSGRERLTTGSPNAPKRVEFREARLVFYDADDLAVAPTLASIISNHIEADGWRENGGDNGTIQLVGTTLYVVASDATHDEITRVLAAVHAPSPSPWAGNYASKANETAKETLQRLRQTWITVDISYIDMTEVASLVQAASGVRVEYEAESLGRARVDVRRLMRLGHKRWTCAGLMDAAMQRLKFHGGDEPCWSIDGDHALIASSNAERNRPVTVVYDVREPVDRAMQGLKPLRGRGCGVTPPETITDSKEVREWFVTERGKATSAIGSIVMNTIAPIDWQQNGGADGLLTCMEYRLVISAPLHIQVQVEEFLRELVRKTDELNGGMLSARPAEVP